MFILEMHVRGLLFSVYKKKGGGMTEIWGSEQALRVTGAFEQVWSTEE